MQLRLFILPVKNLSAAEAEMNAFLRSQRVLAVKKEFVANGENSCWRRNHLPFSGWRMRS
jgi:phage protein D